MASWRSTPDRAVLIRALAGDIIHMGYSPSLFGQEGWILVKFFFCAFMAQDGVEVHYLAKKERGQYPAILTEQAWSIKGLLYGFRGNISYGTQQVVRSGRLTRIVDQNICRTPANFYVFIKWLSKNNYFTVLIYLSASVERVEKTWWLVILKRIIRSLTSSMSPTNAINIHIRLLLEDIQQLKIKKKLPISVTMKDWGETQNKGYLKGRKRSSFSSIVERNLLYICLTFKALSTLRWRNVKTKLYYHG